MEVTEHIELLNRGIIRAMRRLAKIEDEKKKENEMLKIDLYSWALNEYLQKAKVICHDTAGSN